MMMCEKNIIKIKILILYNFLKYPIYCSIKFKINITEIKSISFFFTTPTHKNIELISRKVYTEVKFLGI